MSHLFALGISFPPFLCRSVSSSIAVHITVKLNLVIMELVKSLLVVGYILYISGLVKAGCKNMLFRASFKNKALQGHVFKTEWASSEGHCRSKCYLDDRCIAYSFGQAAKDKKEMCELNDSDHVMHPDDLVERDGTIYRRAQNKCDCQPFQECRVNFENDTHRCECKPRFTGSRCEIAMKPCDSSPCRNGGTCVDNLASFTLTCTCPAGYTGQFCETQINACEFKPCLNGGTCFPQSIGRGYSCKCSSAVGVNCETKVFHGTYSNAVANCKRQGGNLPSIHSAADNQKVLEVYKKVNNWIWIGLRKSNGQYAWSDGTPYDYTNWTGKPLYNCAYMSDKETWVSCYCTWKLHYTCVFN